MTNPVDTIRPASTDSLIHVRSANRGRQALEARGPNFTVRRAVAIGAGALTLLGGGKLIGMAVDTLRGEPVPTLHAGDPGTEVYTVKQGDRAWSIADGRTDGDVRPLVEAILEQPDARDGLQPGDQVVVPVERDN